MKPTILLSIFAILFAACKIDAAPGDLPKELEIQATPAQKLPGEINGFEPTIAADRRGRVVAAAIDMRIYPGDHRRQATRILSWTSTDGGKTFADPLPVMTENIERSDADPWLQAVSDGRFLLAHLVIRSDSKTGETPLTHRVIIQDSSDGGRSWGPSTELSSPGKDKPVLAVSPKGRHIAVIYKDVTGPDKRSLRLVQSSNGGATWKLASGSPGSKGEMVPTGLVVDDAGQVVAGYTVRDEQARAVVAKTADNGSSWDVTDLGIIGNSRQVLADESDAGIDVLLSGVALASGGGTLHAVYATRSGAGGRPGIWYRSSADGRSWSKGVDLSRNPAAQVRAYPIVAAAEDRVHVAWLERQEGRCRIWYRGSDDRGKSWSSRVEVSKPGRPSDLLTDEGFLFFSGHYMGIAESGDGEAHVAWAVSRQIKIIDGEVWHAKLRIHRP